LTAFKPLDALHAVKFDHAMTAMCDDEGENRETRKKKCGAAQLSISLLTFFNGTHVCVRRWHSTNISSEENKIKQKIFVFTCVFLEKQYEHSAI
jgi:hypothetical protein